MAKRQQLDYNNQELTSNLRRSNGKGVDAFFPETDSPLQEQESVQAVEVLQQSTAAHMHARTGARIPTLTDASGDVHAGASAQVRSSERTHASVPDSPAVSDDIGTNSTAEVLESAKIEAIRKTIRAKRHLSSFTFRFRANELEELDLVMDELNQSDEYKLSKNDAVRTALNWLLADYRERKEESILARVLTDT